MVTGHGMIDYIVVAITTMMTVYLLVTRPERLLWLLPIFLTLHFFVPFGSNLTPGRIVPLLIGGWMIVTGQVGIPQPYRAWIEVLLAAVMLATAAAIIIGDAGLRPILRAASYVNLVILFAFAFLMLMRIRSVRPAIQGIAFAGLLHGVYCVYQVIAYKLGLPFRGIVYAEGDNYAAALAAEEGFRVNGLIDEPKRLGYILFAAALAWILLAYDRSDRPKGGRKPQAPLYVGIAAALVAISALTYSGSYLIAVVAWTGLFVALSRFVLVGAVAVSAGVALALTILPSFVQSYTDSLAQILEARAQEVSSGLDARVVYRQEFFAQDYFTNDPGAAILGVGMGRTNRVLNDTYGRGAGYDGGYLLPLNSQFFEIAFNLGIVGLVILYVGGTILVVATGWSTFESWGVSAVLGFLLIQSIFIDDLLFLSFYAGAVAAYVTLRSEFQAWLRQRSGRGTAAAGDQPGPVRTGGLWGAQAPRSRGS